VRSKLDLALILEGSRLIEGLIQLSESTDSSALGL